MEFKNHTCPACGLKAIDWAFFPHTQDYLRCRDGHVWHFDA